MKKIIICLMMFGAAGAYATGENERATSMGYVNEELDTRQDKFDKLGSDTVVTYSSTTDGAVGTRTITGDLGAESNTSSASLPTVGAVDTKLDNKQDELDFSSNTVLMNTGTAGAPSAKGIYDDSGSYLDQADSLIDAATFNAALQNAINSELSCAQRKIPGDPTSKCLLFNIFTFGVPSRNMFNKNDPNIRRCWIKFEEGIIGQNLNNITCGTTSEKAWFFSAPILVKPNQTYTISNHVPENTGLSPSFLFLDSNLNILDGFLNRYRNQITFTIPNNNSIKYLVFPVRLEQFDYAQLEPGDTVTLYQPYGQNIYIPQNQQ